MEDETDILFVERTACPVNKKTKLEIPDQPTYTPEEMLKLILCHDAVDFFSSIYNLRSYTEMKNDPTLQIAVNEKYQQANETFNANGFSVLHVAVKARNVELIKDLIAHKANVNVLSRGEKEFGWRPIIYALLDPIESTRLEIIHLLVEAGTSLDGALSFPSVIKSPDCLKFLLSKGASVHYKRYSGNDCITPTNMAYSYASLEDFESILKQNPKNLCSLLEKRSLVAQSLIDKRYKKLELILKYGKIDPNGDAFFETDLDTPLNWAIRKGDQKAIDILLKWNSSLTVGMSPQKNGALHVAAFHNGGNLEIVQKIVSKLNDLFLHNADGMTGMYCAVLAGNVSVAKFLLSKRPDLITREPSNKAFPPMLHVATLHNNPEMVKLLLENDANPFSRDANRTRACDLGMSMGPKMAQAYLSFFPKTKNKPEIPAASKPSMALDFSNSVNILPPAAPVCDLTNKDK